MTCHADKSARLSTSQVSALCFRLNVKTWESLLLAYPKSQDFALPLHQDKQLELAHAVEYCILGYNTPNADVSVAFLQRWIQICEI